MLASRLIVSSRNVLNLWAGCKHCIAEEGNDIEKTRKIAIHVTEDQFLHGFGDPGVFSERSMFNDQSIAVVYSQFANGHLEHIRNLPNGREVRGTLAHFIVGYSHFIQSNLLCKRFLRHAAHETIILDILADHLAHLLVFIVYSNFAQK